MGFELVLEEPRKAYKKCVLAKSCESVILELEIPIDTRVYFSGPGSFSEIYGLVDRFKIVSYSFPLSLFGGTVAELKDPTVLLDFLDDGRFWVEQNLRSGEILVCSNLPIKVFWTKDRAAFYFV